MKKLIFILPLLICVVGLTAVFAVDPPPIDPGDPDPVPVDGGAGFLLAAGAAYGYKKIKMRFKKK